MKASNSNFQFVSLINHFVIVNYSDQAWHIIIRQYFNGQETQSLTQGFYDREVV